MIEHFVVLLFILYLINLIRKKGIKSRGKTGIISYFTKLILRLSRKLWFVNDKIEKELEVEAAKNTD